MTIGPAREPGGAQALMMGARDPSELINRAEASPLKWNLDKFSVPMLPGRHIACGHYLYDLSKKRGNVDGVADGDACARYRGCTKTGEPVIRGTVAGNLGQLSCRPDSCSVSFTLVVPSESQPLDIRVHVFPLDNTGATCWINTALRTLESKLWNLTFSQNPTKIIIVLVYQFSCRCWRRLCPTLLVRIGIIGWHDKALCT